MAENTRMKEVTSDIRDLKKVVELLEQRDNDFAALLDTRDQQTANRLDGIEAALENLRLTLVHHGPHPPPPFSTIRREKGLCYTCDERFSPNHRCPNKHYMILQVDEE